MPPSYVHARTRRPGATSTSAMRAVRSISTIFGSGFVSRASASLRPASQFAGANEAAARAGARPPHTAHVQAKSTARIRRTEEYFGDTVKNLPCDACGRDVLA